jgi:hypothetical protein
MASKWQVWYPHIIDAWQGSATIQTFSHAAYRGYHNLIMEQFQAEDGKLPDDDRQLAKLSRLGAEWASVAQEVREALTSDGNGRIYSTTQFELWTDAHSRHLEHVARMDVINKRRNERRNEGRNDERYDSRNINATCTVTAAVTTETGTGTGTETKTGKTKNTCAEASSAPALDPDGSPLCLLLNDGSEYAVPAKDCVRWASVYPAVNVLEQLLKMREWCISHPRNCKTRRGVGAFITSWLGREQDRGPK